MYVFIHASSAVWVTGGSGMWSDWQERWRASIRRCRQEHDLSVTVCMYALVFASFAAQVPSVVNSIVEDSRRVGIIVAAFGGCTNEACVARESGARGDK